MRPKPPNRKENFLGVKKTLQNKHPTSNTRSSKFDIRPIRDPEWMNSCQNLLIEFLESSDYSADIDQNKLLKLTALDVRMMFDHLIKLTSPTFHLNDSDLSWSDRILKFLHNLNYPATITKTHLANPAIRSSVPIILATFDYIRRMVTVYYNTDPQMVMPRYENYSENMCNIISKSLSEYYHLISLSEEASNDENGTLKNIVFRNAGILSDEEIEKQRDYIQEMEDLFAQLEEAKEKETKVSTENKILKLQIEQEKQKGAELNEQYNEQLAHHNIDKREVDKLEKRVNELTTKRQMLQNDGTLRLIKDIECDIQGKEELEVKKQMLTNEIDEMNDQLSSFNKKINSFRLEVLAIITEKRFQILDELSIEGLVSLVRYCSFEDIYRTNSNLNIKIKEFCDQLQEKTDEKAKELKNFEIKQYKHKQKLEQMNKIMENKNKELVQVHQKLTTSLELKKNLEDEKLKLDNECKLIKESICHTKQKMMEIQAVLTEKRQTLQILEEKYLNAQRFYKIDEDIKNKLAETEIKHLSNEMKISVELNKDFTEILEESQETFDCFNEN